MRKGTTDNNRANVSSIQTFFDKLLRGKLTKNLFFDEVPVSFGKDWKDVVVVDCHNPMRDYDAIGMQTVLILLYVKQNPYGVKDVKAMQKLETKLNELIDNNDDPYYHISRKGSYSSYDSVNDIFFNIVQINLIIA